MRVIRRVAVVLLVLVVAACRKADVYPSEVVDNFMNNCTTQSSKKVCRCALDAIQQKFTLEQFLAVEARARAGEEPKELMDAVRDCTR